MASSCTGEVWIGYQQKISSLHRLPKEMWDYHPWKCAKGVDVVLGMRFRGEHGSDKLTVGFCEKAQQIMPS